MSASNAPATTCERRASLILLAWLTALVVGGCGHASTLLGEVAEDLDDQLDDPLLRVNLGSCNKADRDQSFWKTIAAHQPDVWIWVGDIVYADARTPSGLAEAWRALERSEHYVRFREQVDLILGTWDDHDYGLNNADRTYGLKGLSQRYILDFLDEPLDSPRRRREGIHAAHDIDVDGVRVEVVLLDVRYHRDPPAQVDADILGDAQWAWLEAELADGDADIHLLVSGSQYLRSDLSKDVWGEYPRSYARLMTLLDDHDVPGVVLISGDIHVGEISRRDSTPLGYPLYELTTSGLTHTKSVFGLENRYRLALLVDRNFGQLDLTREDDGGVVLHLQLFDMTNTRRAYVRVPLAELQPR